MIIFIHCLIVYFWVCPPVTQHVLFVNISTTYQSGILGQEGNGVSQGILLLFLNVYGNMRASRNNSRGRGGGAASDGPGCVLLQTRGVQQILPFKNLYIGKPRGRTPPPPPPPPPRLWIREWDVNLNYV